MYSLGRFFSLCNTSSFSTRSEEARVSVPTSGICTNCRRSACPLPSLLSPLRLRQSTRKQKRRRVSSQPHSQDGRSRSCGLAVRCSSVKGGSEHHHHHHHQRTLQIPSGTSNGSGNDVSTSSSSASPAVMDNMIGILARRATKNVASRNPRREEHKQFVSWFREAWPYIQGHRLSTFVVVMPGEVLADRLLTDSVLQDVALLHGLGVKIVLVMGAQQQIDELLMQRGLRPRYGGGYRITDQEALEAAMEASGRIRVDVEAKLSRGLAIPALRRHGENDRWHEAGISVASGNYVAAQRRGVVDGVDFGFTGEVRKVDLARIEERLASGSIVLLGNLGYSITGEVLNCNSYDVAAMCAVGLHADKLICLLEGPLLDDNGRPIHYVTLKEADELIRTRSRESDAAACYVRSLGIVPGHAKLLEGYGGGGMLSRNASLETANTLTNNHHHHHNNNNNGNGSSTNGRMPGSNGSHTATSAPFQEGEEALGKGGGVGRGGGGAGQESEGGGLACGTVRPGEERQAGGFHYLPELTAAVCACRGGVRRVHLLDSNMEGALLLELYTRDGIGTMVSSDMYEGTRQATAEDVSGIKALLQPLENAGTLVKRTPQQILEVVSSFKVVEREGAIVACAALMPYHVERCAEVAAFVVSPACRGQGRGDMLLDYLETLAIDTGIERLFLLTTRTADWFVQRGFTQCDWSWIPEEKRKKVDQSRGSKCFMKVLQPIRRPMVARAKEKDQSASPTWTGGFTQSSS